MGFAGGIFEINEYILDRVSKAVVYEKFRIIWTNDNHYNHFLVRSMINVYKFPLDNFDLQASQNF